jgi:histone deacetylase complex regulatory component SIN3
MVGMHDKVLIMACVQAKERLSRAAEQARMSSDKARAPIGGRIGNRAGYEPAAGRGGFEHGAGPIPGAGFTRPPVMGKDRERMRDLDREAEREASSRFEQDRLAAREESERDRERNRLIDRARDRLTVGMGPGKSPRMQVVARRRRGREEEMHLTLTPSERTFFERIKACLGNREAWVEFLKCLDLYSAEVISRAELTTLLADIFGPQNMKLLDELKQLLNNRGALEMTAEDVWYSMPIGEIDLSQAARCTPSYRQLPDGYPLLACSERSHLEREMCNDHWVSVPTGSEDFSFKIMRKNQYEDQLFRCEDERYEIDMVIENNVSAIRVLEPLAEEIQALKEYTKGVEWQFRLDRRSLGVLHLRAIARVYGEFGNEVLEVRTHLQS